MNQVLHTQTISWYETSKPPTGIAALLQQFWLVQPSHDPMFKKKTVSWPTICSSVWSTQFLHFWHQPVSPSCTISISTLTFRVVQDAPPLQLSYVPILPSPSVAQPHTAFDVPVPLGEDWNNKKHPTSLGWYHWWFKILAITSWYGKYPVNYRVFYIRGGCLGFLPSTSSNKAWLLDSLRKFPASICRSTSRRYSWSESFQTFFFRDVLRISRSTGA